jgi:hypothetical protein
MKLIKVTALNEKSPIYINVEYIGHFYEVAETTSYGTVDKPKHTVIGVTTHNNGGFRITESIEKILKLIQD